MTDRDLDIQTSFPILSTERLDLIEINQKHLSDLFELFGHEDVTEFYNIQTLTKEEDAQQIIDWFRSRFHDKLGLRWGIALKGEKSIIGTIGFNNFTKGHRANIGYDLKTDYWNNGLMTEALKATIEYGFEKLEINRIEAEVMPGNIYSEKVLNKLGFKKEGILRDWMLWNNKHYDMIMYSLLKNDKE